MICNILVSKQNFSGGLTSSDATLGHFDARSLRVFVLCDLKYFFLSLFSELCNEFQFFFSKIKCIILYFSLCNVLKMFSNFSNYYICQLLAGYWIFKNPDLLNLVIQRIWNIRLWSNISNASKRFIELILKKYRFVEKNSDVILAFVNLILILW